MRNAVVMLLTLAAACSVSFAANAVTTTRATDVPALLTPDEVKGVDGVVAAMLAAGFPDARNATVYSGKITIHATFDPLKDPMPLPSDASNMQETIPSSAQVRYGYEFDGLHFKLADGSWLISVALHFVPKQGDAIDATAATKVDLATLTADAKAAHPFDAATTAAKSVARIAPEQRERSTAAMNELMPVIMHLHWNLDDLAPATLLLRRAGWSQADDLSLAIADIRSQNYWQIRPWTAPDSAFDPTGKYPNTQAEQQAWAKAHTVYVSEPPAVALRRAMFRFSRAQIMIPDPENALLATDIAAAICKAAVDEKDPQENIARIDALAAGAKLPVAPAANADLAARLQSWEARPRPPKMVVSSTANAANPSISTAFVAPPPAYVPVPTDLDALVALLADERPSRFADFSGPRAVGDNAWRALAVLLKADPRTLAGGSTDQPWTKAERQTAAKAVQAWWAGHRAEYIEK